MPRPRIHSSAQQDQYSRSILQFHPMPCSSTGRWSQTMPFRLGMKENSQHWKHRHRGMNNMTAVWLHQREERAEFDISSEEAVGGSVPSRRTDTSNAIQGEVAAVVQRWSNSSPGRRGGTQKQMGGDLSVSAERHTNTHGRTSEQRSRQPQTPRGRQTGHDPSGERTHSEEVPRLVGTGPRSDRHHRSTTPRNISR